MTAARAPRHADEVGCLLARETGVVVVLTDHGPLRASYGARMLVQLARDRAALPEPGEWVALRRWCDGPVTVEGLLAHRPATPLADVVRLHPPAEDDR